MTAKSPEALARRKASRRGLQRAWTMKRTKLLRELKENVPCMDCGRVYPPEVMDYDHVRGEKLFSIGAGPRKAWDKLMQEIAKCDLVCSNCHRIRHTVRGRTRVAVTA